MPAPPESTRVFFKPNPRLSREVVDCATGPLVLDALQNTGF